MYDYFESSLLFVFLFSFLKKKNVWSFNKYNCIDKYFNISKY